MLSSLKTKVPFKTNVNFAKGLVTFFVGKTTETSPDFYELARSFDIEIVTDADVIVALTVLHDKSQR